MYYFLYENVKNESQEVKDALKKVLGCLINIRGELRLAKISLFEGIEDRRKARSNVQRSQRLERENLEVAENSALTDIFDSFTPSPIFGDLERKWSRHQWDKNCLMRKQIMQGLKEPTYRSSFEGREPPDARKDAASGAARDSERLNKYAQAAVMAAQLAEEGGNQPGMTAKFFTALTDQVDANSAEPKPSPH